MYLFKLLNPLYKPVRIATMTDATTYKIETRIGSYIGWISDQDDIMIWLRTTNHKSVKILKTNIDRISIVDNTKHERN